MKPFYTVFTMDDLRSIPHVKLYVIIVDLEARGQFINGCEKDLVLMAVKYTKSIGGKVCHSDSFTSLSRSLKEYLFLNS